MSNESEVKSKKKKVGYKNPPEHSQFKAGQSGNPSGRKKAKHLPKSFDEILATEVVGVINGKKTSLTYEEYYYQKLYSRTMADDPRWGKMFDKLILERYKNRLRQSESEYEEDSDQPIAAVKIIRPIVVSARVRPRETEIDDPEDEEES